MTDRRQLAALSRTGRLTATDVEAEADAYDMAAGRMEHSGKALAMRRAAQRMRAAAAEVRAAAKVPGELAELAEEGEVKPCSGS